MARNECSKVGSTLMRCDTYKGSIIHCLGNFVKKSALLREVRNGILWWYGNNYDRYFTNDSRKEFHEEETYGRGYEYVTTPEIDELGIALVRVKIILEKYQALHFLGNPSDQDLSSRGFSLEYRRRMERDEPFGASVTINLRKLDRVSDQIISLIIQKFKRLPKVIEREDVKEDAGCGGCGGGGGGSRPMEAKAAPPSASAAAPPSVDDTEINEFKKVISASTQGDAAIFMRLNKLTTKPTPEDIQSLNTILERFNKEISQIDAKVRETGLLREQSLPNNNEEWFDLSVGISRKIVGYSQLRDKLITQL